MPGSNTGSATEGVGQNPFDAVSAFDSFLNPEEGDQESEGQEAEVDAEAGESELEESAEAQAEGSESSEEGEEQTEEQSGESEEEGEQPQGRLYTVRVDGKEEKVPEHELIAGYQRQSDYTRKTQVLAETRKALEQEAGQAKQERSEYAQLLPQLRKALETVTGREPNWEELRAKDPAQAAIAKQRWDERQQKLDALRQEEDRVKQQEIAERQNHAQQIIREEDDKTLKLIPHWQKPEAKQKEEAAITKMLLDLGFKQDETKIYDSRARKIAWMAMKYLAISAQKPELRKKIATAPTVKPGNGNQKPRQQTNLQQAQKRLQKSGSIKDATEIMKHFL
jgi:hypothetical protein